MHVRLCEHELRRSSRDTISPPASDGAMISSQKSNAPRAWPRAWGHHGDDNDSSRDINCDNEDVTVIADD